MGIAGDKLLRGAIGPEGPGDQVITGPHNSVRGMADGDLVKIDNRQNQRR